MEESPHEGREKPPKVEAQGDEKVVLEDSAALAVEVDGKDSSSSSSSGDEEAEAEDKILQDQDQVEILVSDSAVESVEVEPQVSLSEESSKDIEPSAEDSRERDVAELDAKETQENNVDSPILTDLSMNGLKEEEPQQLSYADTAAGSAPLADMEAKGIDEGTTEPNVVSKGIEQTTISYLADSENGVVPSAAPAGSGDSLTSPNSENVEDSLEAANVPMVETRDDSEPVNKPEIRESTGNQPITSLSNHPVQPTSWRSCCGLFEVLRRSDR